MPVINFNVAIISALQGLILAIAYFHAITLFLAQLTGRIKDGEQTRTACFNIIALAILAYVLGTVRAQ